ncbi:ImmA/IrrE family metallo-endopeptidase [Gardnerella leopoldii]|uniref:ImmA/IrrE family metallo-endopeptidase n=1 Tax=Gardnerella leopoldii TaxID=2792978 RepID=UPI001573BD8E|nr:ImmA/IrrE family metallo-endopeptidase [Gardnerella vaginalis]
MRKKVSYSDIFDVNKKTGALILGASRLDDYATKFLNKYCKDALNEPMPLPVDDILKKMHLKIAEERLSTNLDIFGCCLLIDGNIKVYNEKTDEYAEKFFNKGTIVIDPEAVKIYGDGSKRNTLVHELLHWEKDKTYFEILNSKNENKVEKIYPTMLRQSQYFYTPSNGKRTKENQIQWLEWQAHKLAPRVLMPYSTFKKKATELIKKEVSSGEELVQKLSSFFQVSKESAKYRLFEVGLEKELSSISDFKYIFEDQLTKNEFTKLTPQDAFKLLENNKIFEKWVNHGNFIFVDGYFVIASKEYVKIKDGKLALTTKAKRNLSKCVINIRLKHHVEHGINSTKDKGTAFLLKDDGVDIRFLYFAPSDQKAISINLNRVDKVSMYSSFIDVLKKDNFEYEDEFTSLLTDQNQSLCECLWYSFEKNGLRSPEKFNEATCLNKNYHGKIKNNKYNNMSKGTLWAICVGLGYSVRTIQKIFAKSNYTLKEQENPDKFYLKILDRMPGISIEDFNGILIQSNMEELGSKLR